MVCFISQKLRVLFFTALAKVVLISGEVAHLCFKTLQETPDSSVFVFLSSKWCLSGLHQTQGSGSDQPLVYHTQLFRNENRNKLTGLPARPQSNNPLNVRLGLGCGQQWLSKPSCPNSEDKCKAGPDWGQGVAWQGCHGDGAGLGREGMLNEAIVWPKWSTPHKEWHIQTVIQAYCCGGPAECCRSTVYSAGSTTHHKERARSEGMKLWHQQEQQEHYWNSETF